MIMKYHLVSLAAVLFGPLMMVVVKVTAAPSTTSKLFVHIPHKLYKEEGYDHRGALFGMPHFGGSITQNVFYADSNLCDANVDTSKGSPTRDTENGVMKPWPAPYILLVDRGECTFVKKVRNAQHAGASAVLIADNLCMCSDPSCDRADGPCETQEPIMADDGSGSDISIPSFMLFKNDADAIKEELRNNRPVQIEMKWALPAPDDRVEYQLWTMPSELFASRDFIMNFKNLAVALGSHAYFAPHMYIYDGIRAGCVGNAGENECYTLCTNNGRYCSTDPDDDLDKGISGADVVTESLRRICIWDQYGASDGIGAQWWNYVQEFNTRCATTDYFSNNDCIQDAYNHAGVDGGRVEGCMKDSGGVAGDTTNIKLELELAARETNGVVMIPSAFVNTVPIRGSLSANNIFTAICAGFFEGTKPTICEQCGNSPDPVLCVENGGYSSGRSGGSNRGVSTGFFTFSLMFLVGGFVGVGFWHYKRTREEMRDQVRGIMAEYMPLEEQDNNAGSSFNLSSLS